MLKGQDTRVEGTCINSYAETFLAEHALDCYAVK